KLEPRLLFRMMSDIAVGDGKDKPGEYQLESYYVQEAFSLIGRSTEFTVEEKARLEFTYIDVLATPWEREGYGVPNLERYLEKHPELFVQAIIWTYRRDDGGEDPNEWKVTPEDAKQLAEKGYRLLEGVYRIPGHDEQGALRRENLAAWVATVRSACAELARREVGDICLGRLFSAAPVGNDGVWPCEPVREVIEDLQSSEICEGAHTGLYNSRGVHSRGEGGDQERDLAQKYRAWAHALQYSHPFLSSTLLAGMAKTYEREANREDLEAGVRRRLR
ncbi:MAG: addiction module antitoxin, partial [Proteobacteria bacterium]|nr:addiction module antitoxin [Pseudomonadota bacterium]